MVPKYNRKRFSSSLPHYFSIRYIHHKYFEFYSLRENSRPNELLFLFQFQHNFSFVTLGIGKGSQDPRMTAQTLVPEHRCLLCCRSKERCSPWCGRTDVHWAAGVSSITFHPLQPRNSSHTSQDSSPLNIFPFLNDLVSWRPSISITHNKSKLKEGSCLSTKSWVSLPGYFKQMFNTSSCFMSVENSACCYSRMQ